MPRNILISFYLLLAFTFVNFNLIAQPDSDTKNKGKYQSLLWKIEGKDLEKPSYLYGTMHVSHKIAYHLSDEFYQALKDVDQIALETNPEDWMDNLLDNGNFSYYGGFGYGTDLYSSFSQKIPEDEEIEGILKMNNEIVNGILYRNNEYQQNFEEDTYLDMFIFQAGGKQNKPVRALEDVKESENLAKKAAQASYDPDRELPTWLKKEMEEKGMTDLLEDAYRDKDLDFIDSLNRAYYPEDYNKYMLYERNYNIVEAFDTVVLNGTVFIGIGAAHLPGEDGVIEILRRRGYTVTPYGDELTDKGKNIKENFENTFADRVHQKYSSADNFIDISLPEKLYEFKIRGINLGLNMDITNGGYFMIFRVSTYDHITDEPYTLEKIEGMLYENIPGKILKQENIEFQGYPALHIENQLKNGEHQRYLIVETPIELIVFKLGGKKDYALKYGDKYFKDIKLNKRTNGTSKTQPFYGHFAIDIPGNPIIHGNNKYSSGGTLSIESIDESDNSFYFASSLIYHDYEYFEDDDFEVEHIHKKWYEDMDTTADYTQVKMEPYARAFSSGVLPKTQKKVYLNSIKKGTKYILLGTINADSLKAKKYFDSFEFTPYIHEDEKFELRTDTSLHYTVMSPVKAPDVSGNRGYYDYYSAPAEEDTIASKFLTNVFETPYQERIIVNYHKYHNYTQLEHLDSIWKDVTRYWDDEDSDFKILDLKKGKDKQGNPNLSFKIVSKEKNCSRMFHHYYVMKHGVMYNIEYDSDKDMKEHQFYDTFMETFTLKDTLIGSNPLHDKTALFFENINSKDSLTRIKALESYNTVKFTEDNTLDLMDVIKNFKFDEKELDIKVGLLEILGQLEDNRVSPFLKDMYNNSEFNSAIQLEVIYALAKNANSDNMKTILSFLNNDIPLGNEYSISNSFSPLRDSSALQYSKELFPDLLSYSSIPEYKSWIYRLSVLLKEEGHLKSKVFKKYKKQIVNEMKIEFKREKTREIEEKSNNNRGYGYNSRGSFLYNYISMLSPFYNKDSEVKELFDKIMSLDDVGINTYLQAQLAKIGQNVDKNWIAETAKDPKKRLDVYSIFKRYDQLSKFPKEYLNQKDITEAYLYSDRNYPKADSVEFVKELNITEGEDEFVIYFFRVMKKEYNYYSDEEKEGDWKMQCIAYKLDDEEPIKTYDYYHTATSEVIDLENEDEEELEEFEKTSIEKIKYSKRKRVRFSSGGYDYYDYY